jgi:hypothetical protein
MMRKNNCVELSRPAKGRRVVKALMAEHGVGNEAVATVKSKQFSAMVQGLADLL